MGSSGSGNLTDYSKPTSTGNKGGASGNDPCRKAFSDILEEVERCEYYINHHDVPPPGSNVTVRLRKRLEVLYEGKEVIGYLPTSRNYLASCIESGINYNGVVTNSRLKPMPSVSVDISPA
jgi:hypothetical protein